MGQKINPVGFRLSVNRNWGSKWYANTKNFPGMLAEVDILTGEKTILSYLLKPVLRAKQAAFTER